jgi:hypothetical protein
MSYKKGTMVLDDIEFPIYLNDFHINFIKKCDSTILTCLYSMNDRVSEAGVFPDEVKLYTNIFVEDDDIGDEHV